MPTFPAAVAPVSSTSSLVSSTNQGAPVPGFPIQTSTSADYESTFHLPGGGAPVETGYESTFQQPPVPTITSTNKDTSYSPMVTTTSQAAISTLSTTSCSTTTTSSSQSSCPCTTSTVSFTDLPAGSPMPTPYNSLTYLGFTPMGLTPQGRHLSSLGSSEPGHSEASPNPSVFTPQLDHGQHSSFDLHSIFLLPCSDTECEVTLTGTKLSVSGGAASTGDNNATTVQRTIRVPGNGYNAINPTSIASSAQLSETVHFSLPPPIAGKVRYRRTIPPASPTPTIITRTSFPSSSSSSTTIPHSQH